MAKVDVSDEKQGMFWAISGGVILLSMGIGSLFGWMANRKNAEGRKPRRTERKADPEAAPAEPEEARQQ